MHTVGSPWRQIGTGGEDALLAWTSQRTVGKKIVYLLLAWLDQCLLLISSYLQVNDSFASQQAIHQVDNLSLLLFLVSVSLIISLPLSR